MCEISTMVSCQWVTVNGRDGAGVYICALNQEVDEEEKQHSKKEVWKGTCYCDTFYQNACQNIWVVLSTCVADKKTNLLPSTTDK